MNNMYNNGMGNGMNNNMMGQQMGGMNMGMQQPGYYDQGQQQLQIVDTPHKSDRLVRELMSELTAHVEYVSAFLNVPMVVENDEEENLTRIKVESNGADILPLGNYHAQLMNNPNIPVMNEFYIYIVDSSIYSSGGRASGANAMSLYTRIQHKTNSRVCWVTPQMYGDGNEDLKINLVRIIKSMMPWDLNSENIHVKELNELTQMNLTPASYDFIAEGGNGAILTQFNQFVDEHYTSVDIRPAADRVFMAMYNQMPQNQGVMAMGMMGGIQTATVNSKVLGAITTTISKQKLENGVMKFDIVITSFLETLTWTVNGLFKALVNIMVQEIVSEGGTIGSVTLGTNVCIPSELRFVYEQDQQTGLAPVMPAQSLSVNEYWFIPNQNAAYGIDALLNKDTLSGVFTAAADRAKIEKIDTQTDLEKFLTSKSCIRFDGPNAFVMPINYAAFGGQQPMYQQPMMGQQQQQMGNPMMGGMQQPMGQPMGAMNMGMQQPMGNPMMGGMQQPMGGMNMGMQQPMGGYNNNMMYQNNGY